MKKFVAILIALCLAMTGVLTWLDLRGAKTETPAAAEVVSLKTLDLAALRASCDLDAVVATVDGEDVLWSEYFYWLQYYAGQAEYYLNMMAQYGATTGWDTVLDENGTTYLTSLITNADGTLKENAALERLCAENAVELSEDEKAAIQATLQSDIIATCGENGTEEQFEEYIDSLYLTRAIYDKMVRINYLYPACAVTLYGENGALISEQEALAYLNDHGYMCSNHILLLTIDTATGEALDEAAANEKKAQAEKLAGELQAIADPKERLARFAELKSQYDEDTGKVANPNGYLFAPGTMYPVFEDATAAQGEYEVSDPVLSQAGYHVIMTLPLDADMTITSAEGSTNARSLLAGEKFNAEMTRAVEKTELVMAPGFTMPDLRDYLVETA